MNHPLRLYGKKRGNRRTGSGAVGRIGLSLFFAAFLLAGIGFFAVLANVLVLPEWRVNTRFVEHHCTVLRERLGETHSDGGAVYRPELLVAYEVDGNLYESWTYDITQAYTPNRADNEAILEQFEVGRQYTCWYDPVNPETVVLKRGFSWFSWLMLLLPFTFMIIGGGGLIYQALNWSTSTERRLAMARRATELDLFERADDSGDEFPTVPREANLINSPGTTLAYRLPIAVSPGWALVAIVVACLFWNGMVALFVTIAIGSHIDGDPDWFLTLFVLPFLLIGCGLIYFAIQQLLITTGVGPTLVEISDHPLQPGSEYQVFISQTGRLTMNSLKVLLRCQEQATYQQGTNSRTETCPVFEQEVFRQEGFEIQQGLPFEATLPLRVPESAMHSFKSAHNAIQWKLIVLGDIAGWPNYEREFPLLIYPRAARRPL